MSKRINDALYVIYKEKARKWGWFLIASEGYIEEDDINKGNIDKYDTIAMSGRLFKTRRECEKSIEVLEDYVDAAIYTKTINL